MPTIAEVQTWTCESCGEECPRDEGETCTLCYGFRCDDCDPCSCDDDDDDDSDDDGDSRIHEWNYRPRKYRPKGDFYVSPLLGVELEVGGADWEIADVVQGVDDSEDHLYLKQDASISGAEIVTHPMTLGYARKYPFDRLLNGLRAAGCWVNDGYGLHIHVSRNAFKRKGKLSAAHQMLWLLFIYRNVVDLEDLARRKSDRWAAFRTPAPGELARKAKHVAEAENRYVAVNCNNERTFELRFFASTLDDREFFAALQFADASIRYTRDIAVSDVLRGNAITWDHFTQWVARHDYPQLSAELGVSR